MKEIIRYAHCVKWTPGQLDREPFSQYESRTIEVEMTLFRNHDEDCDEWIVRYNNKVIANEPWGSNAMAMAAYNMMNTSRIEAERHAIWHEQEMGNPKVT